MTPMELSGSITVLGYGLIAIGPALGIAWIFVSAIQGIARQPEAKSAIMSPVYVGMGLVEALAILGFVLALIK